MRDIGKNIKRLRERSGLTQENLAERLFVTRQTVSNYENGRTKPDIDMLMNIARVLEVDVNHVLYGSPAPKSRKTAYRRMIIGAAAVLLISAVLVVLRKLLAELYQRYIAVMFIWPFLGVLLDPVRMAVLGWCFLQGISLLFDIAPMKKPYAGRLKCVLLGVLAVCVTVPLPFILWLWSHVVEALLGHINVGGQFPYIPVYQELRDMLVYINLNHPLLYFFPGAALWLCGFPQAKKETAEETETN